MRKKAKLANAEGTNVQTEQRSERSSTRGFSEHMKFENAMQFISWLYPDERDSPILQAVRLLLLAKHIQFPPDGKQVYLNVDSTLRVEVTRNSLEKAV